MNWINEHHMSLNAKKCKFMIVLRKTSKWWSDVQLDEPIERALLKKYLGVWLSDDLSWSHHIDIVTTKATKQKLG